MLLEQLALLLLRQQLLRNQLLLLHHLWLHQLLLLLLHHLLLRQLVLLLLIGRRSLLQLHRLCGSLCLRRLQRLRLQMQLLLLHVDWAHVPAARPRR